MLLKSHRSSRSARGHRDKNPYFRHWKCFRSFCLICYAGVEFHLLFTQSLHLLIHLQAYNYILIYSMKLSKFVDDLISMNSGESSHLMFYLGKLKLTSSHSICHFARLSLPMPSAHVFSTHTVYDSGRRVPTLRVPVPGPGKSHHFSKMIYFHEELILTKEYYYHRRNRKIKFDRFDWIQ